MKVTLEIPEAAMAALTDSYGDISRAMIESLAVEGYRSGRLSSFTVGQTLGHESRWQTQDFLAAQGAWPGQTVSEFELEATSLRAVMMS